LLRTPPFSLSLRHFAAFVLRQTSILSGLRGISVVTVDGDGHDLTLLCVRVVLRNDWLRLVFV
jgi:hypothetical protein